jgi:hypothetical protein
MAAPEFSSSRAYQSHSSRNLYYETYQSNDADYGDNSPIGLATANRFVEEGGYVFIMGRRR